jgi:P27 family predicted phage terminase small subunit
MAKATGRPNGRPPKPTEVKRALGNQGHRPLPAAPAPNQGLRGSVTIPVAPPLSVDARDLWDKIWTAGRTWLSPESDYLIVTYVCQTHDELEEIRRSISTGQVKRFYTLPNGSMVTHPLVSQLKDLRSQMTAWLASLGFSPADRARLGIGEVRINDALDDLQHKRIERVKVSNA